MSTIYCFIRGTQLSEEDQSSLLLRLSIRGISWPARKPRSNDTSSTSPAGGFPPAKARLQKTVPFIMGPGLRAGQPSGNGAVWFAAARSQVQVRPCSPGTRRGAGAPAGSLRCLGLVTFPSSARASGSQGTRRTTNNRLWQRGCAIRYTGLLAGGEKKCIRSPSLHKVLRESRKVGKIR